MLALYSVISIIMYNTNKNVYAATVVPKKLKEKETKYGGDSKNVYATGPVYGSKTESSLIVKSSEIKKEPVKKVIKTPQEYQKGLPTAINMLLDEVCYDDDMMNEQLETFNKNRGKINPRTNKPYFSLKPIIISVASEDDDLIDGYKKSKVIITPEFKNRLEQYYSHYNCSVQLIPDWDNSTWKLLIIPPY